MSAVKIQRLALPKGVNLKCEICGEPATFRCLECPTFYCTQEHFETDWYGVLHRIHRDVTALREERKTVGTEKDRQQREKDLQAIRRKVLEVSRATAQKCVVQGKYQYAAAGALYALKMAEVLYGQDAPEVVAAHLLLAEIHLGLQRLQSAEELLTLANWSLFKHPEENQKMRPHLYRNFGRLHLAQHRFEDALKACALDIYYSASEYGAEAIKTAPSYFYMARVFRESRDSTNSDMRFYSKVCDIYIKWFEETYGTQQGSSSQDSSSDRYFGEVEIQEAIEIMRQIRQHTEETMGSDHRSTNHARVALGLLQAHTKDFVPAVSALQEAEKSLTQSLGETHHLTLQCRDQLKVVLSMHVNHQEAKHKRPF